MLLLLFAETGFQRISSGQQFTFFLVFKFFLIILNTTEYRPNVITKRLSTHVLTPAAKQTMIDVALNSVFF